MDEVSSVSWGGIFHFQGSTKVYRGSHQQALVISFPVTVSVWLTESFVATTDLQPSLLDHIRSVWSPFSLWAPKVTGGGNTNNLMEPHCHLVAHICITWGVENRTLPFCWIKMVWKKIIKTLLLLLSPFSVSGWNCYRSLIVADSFVNLGRPEVILDCSNFTG